MIKSVKGIELWNEAKKIIPGGTQLLSKRSEMYLPGKWPSYFKKAKGVEVEDLDGNKLIDMSIMGIGSCVLGYADEDVNNAVKKVIDDGSMCTLNTFEEVELAKKLIEIHPWAEQVRYCRTGGEAMAVAARVGRAFSKKDKIAFCGYHGWHDWYLSSNIAKEDNLNGHLLPGLEPLGVPRGLLNTALPFKYNNIGELERIIKKHDIGTIIIEPMRHQEPVGGFLEKVRDISNEIGAVLIFDEVTSAWRNNLGGIHLKYGVYPDVAVFGKAISNGFPMAAIIGKRHIMEVFQKSFISSTYWTERIGPAASLATIKKMEEKDVANHISEIGKMIEIGWKKLSEKHGLDISTIGPYSLITLKFNYSKDQEIKTLFIQEMLKRGFLANLTVYVSYSHKKQHVKKYLDNVDAVFETIKKAIDNNEILKSIEGDVAHKGFKRLTD